MSEAHELAQSVLIAAKASADLVFEARALGCLAQCARLSGKLRHASDTSRRAAQLFKRLGAIDEEASTLTTLAQVSMLLGRNDEAVEAALLCVRLSGSTAGHRQALHAHNCLGLAYGWSAHFDLADAALAAAVEIAARCQPPASAYQPKLNLAWVEAARLVDERYQTGRMADLERLRTRVKAFRAESASPDRATAAVTTLPDGTVPFVLTALLACWQGRIGPAQAQAELVVRSLGGTVSWLDALASWVLAEIAWAQGDWPACEDALDQMKKQALAVEHEQLACMAHLLLTQVAERQGKSDAARLELRALRVRERRMSSESLVSREAIVNWQLDARQSERHLQDALVASRQFERWSFEDALTGIANRRCFEQALAQRLGPSLAAGTPLAVAMIDVDHFKAVNDTFSHEVGDRVLKTLAGVLVATVRTHDLPARLAGDEFVVLFADADAGVAEEICARIHAAVESFDWNSIADGLALSVSIGVGTAAPGDSAESLLRRSDLFMYRDKANSRF